MCAALLACAALSGCLVDDEKCGSNQVEIKGDTPTCVCIPGSVPDPRGYGCHKCGEHEEVAAGMCQCSSGFTRMSPTGPCEMATGGVLGAACSTELPCADPYPYCASSGGQSFCTTRGCAANDDCEQDWKCSNPGADGFCVRPMGLGKTCNDASACAGSEATFCESFMTKTCIIEKCVSDPGSCPSGNVCCDLTGLIGTSVCTPRSVLMGGMCPDGQAPVMP
jgi:hypothetical protein